MDFFIGEKVLVSEDIKTNDGIIKKAEQIVITKKLPNIIEIQWDKQGRKLKALCPPKSICKYTEASLKELKDDAIIEKIAKFEKQALDFQGLINNIKDFWEKNKDNVKKALETITKNIKRNIDELVKTVGLEKVYNALKAILGIEYTDTVAKYIPEMSAAKMGSNKNKKVFSSENYFDKMVIASQGNEIPNDILVEHCMNKISSLIGDNYILNEKQITALKNNQHFMQEEKDLIVKASNLIDNYVSNFVEAPIQKMYGKEISEKIVAAYNAKDMAQIKEIIKTSKIDVDKIDEQVQQMLEKQVADSQKEKIIKEKQNYENFMKNRDKKKLNTHKEVNRIVDDYDNMFAGSKGGFTNDVETGLQQKTLNQTL